LQFRESKIMSLENYDFLKKIGQGNFGYVWLAKRKTDGQEFAIKFVHLKNSSV
jgi:serine/threonine protein kinase